ncbi:MAG: carbamoyltransferase C-terminal domain-containing protein [Myxococcota bacterium]
MITVGLYGIRDTTHGSRPTYTHDHGVAFMRDGCVLGVVELERWTGRKHDNRLPEHIHDILAAFVPVDEPVRFVSVNAFVGSTFLSTDGNLRIEPRHEVAISDEPVPAEVIWYPDGLHRRPAEGWVVCHELAHIGSLLPFVGAFEDGALAAHIDGGASRSACSFWRAEGGGVQLEEASWDLLKDVVNNFNVNPAVRAILGFAPEDHLAIPGKLMGFAALGSPRDDLEQWLAAERWLLECDDAIAAAKVLARLGAVDARDRGCQDLCATLQRSFERSVVQTLVERARGAQVLYLAGGAGLNVPTNAKLQGHFDKVWIPPGTNDSGLALGAAAWVEFLERGTLPIHGPFLHSFGAPAGEPTTDAVADVAIALLEGAVIGVCNGAGEVGPRALGHRSILSCAHSVDLRVRVSETIKRREWYRPLAPILCAEAARIVLGPQAVTSPLSRWMLASWGVQPAWHDAFAGVLHADGSVRAQVVDDDGGNSWMHALLQHLWRAHGVPGLINTSFNGAGRPILQRHDEALGLARELGLDGVVVHGSLHRF